MGHTELLDAYNNGMKDWQRDQLLTAEEMKALWEWCDRC